MKKFKWYHLVVVLFHLLLLRILVIPLAFVACVFMRETDRKTSHYAQDPNIQRYKLPSIFSWMSTPDEDLAGGMYEPTVKKIYEKFGAYICSVYWIGLRNQAQGFLWLFGWECSKELRDNNKLLNYSLLNKQYDVKLFKIVVGWEVTRDHYLDYTTSGYYAIPQIDIKFK